MASYIILKGGYRAIHLRSWQHTSFTFFVVCIYVAGASYSYYSGSQKTRAVHKVSDNILSLNPGS